jgi:hypothetical protein
MDTADLARRAVRIAVAVCKARARRVAIYAESGALGRAGADAAATGSTWNKCAAGLAPAARRDACPISAYAGSTLTCEISL